MRKKHLKCETRKEKKYAKSFNKRKGILLEQEILERDISLDEQNEVKAGTRYREWEEGDLKTSEREYLRSIFRHVYRKEESRLQMLIFNLA
ncbi:hypothetical protein JTE90_024076 [Oedothorax gibbosus]|uniref:Uncharacterized protein n=1 Tax=Oedothorax gibbosus TaxID=931172 RepID=A0AAV6U779_9ARAC|nr:hypothetical protein JTE90_024076 [Oedothorax gibbosus]